MTAFTLLLTLTLCGPAAVAQSAAFHANGAFAGVSDCSESQTSIECIIVNVTVNASTGSASQKTTFLVYDHLITDPSTGALQEALGTGQIPNSAFQVQGQTDSLNVDTSTVAGFFNAFCFFDPNTNTRGCNLAAPGGVVTGTWNVMRNLFTFRIVGTLTRTFPNMILISTGTQDAQAASASVNVLGGMLANFAGNTAVGTNTNTNISVHVRH
jgi:hypothetical protein